MSLPAPATTEIERPSFVDFAFQLAYASAYQLARAYWRVRRPLTHGALVTLWCRGQVLLVRNSYVPYYSAPGGYLRRDESARAGAVRELREEVGIVAAPDELTEALELTHDWEGRRDHVVIFSLELAERPIVQVDYREVVEAFWFEPQQVARSDVFPPLKRTIAEQVRVRGLVPA